MARRPPSSALFPCSTVFRSLRGRQPKRLFRLLPPALDRLRDLLVMLRHCRKGLNRFQARRSLLLPALFAPFALDLGTPFLRRANTAAPHPSALAPDSGDPAGRYFAPARRLGDT